MTLNDLAERLGVPARQIRFLIAEGILPPAAKTGRAADGYDETHVLQGQRYLALHRMGMKPGSIKVLMAFDDAVPILQAGGVELRVDPGIAPEAIDIEAVLNAVEAALRAYVAKD
ncbi:MerR family transcriptional regulator [Paragemmobacter straminiformis]|uniref:MerR family transcriptional regulator n=1 Tax=Paragemmobacter straminiformis TaxID=2045119 RepID=A0A842I007_9RHOB|nr:MerR family transcriptional regulator [Gemmobacter straminiformis]MBC2834032.1 MerR family transcriptional regulator [Gemmobacter straminiformis]